MVLDTWVNLLPEGFAEAWGSRQENASSSDPRPPEPS